MKLGVLVMPCNEAYKLTGLLLRHQRKYVFLVLMFLSLTCSLPEKADASLLPTTLSVFPSRVAIGAENKTTLASPITIRTAVLNVVNLFAWQIRLYFNATMLNLTTDGVWYPSGHVFADRAFVSVSPVVSSDEKGSYVTFGASLQGEEPTFNGSGGLCQMNFTFVAEGASSFLFSKPLGEDTFLLDSNGEQILFMLSDGGVNSAISLSVSPTETTVGRYVTVSGNISPAMKNVGVGIYLRLVGGSWDTLANVATDLNSDFSYTWKTTKEGTYEIRVSWSGDEMVNSAISRAEIVTIRPALNVAPLVVAVLVISIFVLLYVIKYRKH